MEFKKTLLLLTLSFSVFFANAQHDYVITLNNDTIKGSFKYNIMGDIKFQADKQKKSVLITPNKFREYYIFSQKRELVAKKIPGLIDELFVERLEKGEIELYELKTTMSGSGMVGGNTVGPNTYTNVRWYVSKNGSAPIALKHNSWATFSKERRKNAFYEMLSDNEEIAGKFINDDKFTFDKIRELIILYNIDSKKQVTKLD